MLKILKARFQQNVNWELPDTQAGYREDRGARDPTANIYWILEKAREYRKTFTFASLTTLKPFTMWITTNLFKILQEMGISDHVSYLLRNMYGSQEAIVRTKHGATDWLKIMKGECQGYIPSSPLFNLYAEYIMRNARQDEAQAQIKIAERNMNNLRYADDTICRKWRRTKGPLDESEREEWKSWFKTQHLGN